MPPEKNEEGPRPTTVYTATVTQENTALEVVTQGEVRSRTAINLVSQVGGRIVSVSPEFVDVAGPGADGAGRHLVVLRYTISHLNYQKSASL